MLAVEGVFMRPFEEKLVNKQPPVNLEGFDQLFVILDGQMLDWADLLYFSPRAAPASATIHRLPPALTVLISPEPPPPIPRTEVNAFDGRQAQGGGRSVLFHIDALLLKACSKAQSMSLVVMIHAHAVNLRCSSLDLVQNFLVQCGCFEDALQVFDKIYERDVITWSLMKMLGSSFIDLKGHVYEEALLGMDEEETAVSCNSEKRLGMAVSQIVTSLIKGVVHSPDPDQRADSFYTLSWACNIDGTPFLVPGGSDVLICVINAGNEEIDNSLVDQGDSISVIRTQSLKPPLAVSASKDESVRLLDAHTGICILIIAGAGGHLNEVSSVDSHSPDNCLIARHGMENTLKIWSMNEFWTYVDKSHETFAWMEERNVLAWTAMIGGLVAMQPVKGKEWVAKGLQTSSFTDSAVFAMLSQVNMIIAETHAIMAKGGVIAPVGLYMVALVAQRYAVPWVKYPYVDNALTYSSNLIRHALNGSGTPLQPETPINTCISELFREDLQSGFVFEKNWGLAELDANLSSLIGNFGVATSKAYLTAWKDGLDWACNTSSANCSAIPPRQPCYGAHDLIAVPPDAYNDYYHRTQAYDLIDEMSDRDKDGKTSLLHVSRLGGIELLNFLPSNAGTPLSWAVGHGQQDAVKNLLACIAYPNNETDEGGATPMHVVAEIGNKEGVHCFLDAGGIFTWGHSLFCAWFFAVCLWLLPAEEVQGRLCGSAVRTASGISQRTSRIPP